MVHGRFQFVHIVELDVVAEPAELVVTAATTTACGWWHGLLNVIARFRVKVCTADLLWTYRHILGLQPYSFFDVLLPLDTADLLDREARAKQDPANYEWYPKHLRNPNLRVLPDGRVVDADAVIARRFVNPYEGLKGVPFYAALGSDEIRRADTHEIVHIEQKTINECMRAYFTHAEWKAAEPYGVGVLSRRHVHIAKHVYIGKESNEVLDELAFDTVGALRGSEAQEYGEHMPIAGVPNAIAAKLHSTPLETLAKAADVSIHVVDKLRRGLPVAKEKRDKILEAVQTIEPMRCKHCGKEIQAKRMSYTCSDACRKAASRQRETS